MEKQSNDREYIDLGKLFHALLKKLWLILLIMAVFAFLGFGLSSYVMTPMYEAEIMVYVNNTASSSSSQSSISTTELYAAQSLVETYMVILKSEPSLDVIKESTGVSYSAKTLSQMVQTEAMDNTEVFKVVVTSVSPQEACDIANAIAEMMPERISNIVEGSSVRIVQYAKVPVSPSSPSIPRYTVLGALAGFLLTAVLICVKELSDKRVRSSDILSDRYNIPVIAEIPDLTKTSSGRYGKYGYYASAYGAKEGK